MQIMLINTHFLKQIFTLLLLIGLTTIHINAGATEKNIFQTQLIQEIKNFIDIESQHLAAQDQGILTYKLRGLDPRLQLKPCQSSLEIETVQHNWLRKRTHVKASCEIPQWSLLIGLELTLLRKVLVARTAIERNSSLKRAIEFAERDILSIRNGYIDSVEGILGKVTKRNLVMGQIISPHLIKAEILVPRNSIVEVSAHIGTIAVSSEGVALENGAFGDIIRVRNKQSKKVIEARVVHPNKVEVNL